MTAEHVIASRGMPSWPMASNNCKAVCHWPPVQGQPQCKSETGVYIEWVWAKLFKSNMGLSDLHTICMPSSLSAQKYILGHKYPYYWP